MVEVAVFPIPNTVVFPGQLVPLHIFEPRYRKMVSDCLEDDRLLGVACAAERIAERHLDDLPLEEKLSTNHDTYKAHAIFSAGKVRLDEVLDDGRLIVTVAISQRLEIRDFLQSVPYYLCDAAVRPTDLSNKVAIEHEYNRLRRLTALLLSGRTKEVFDELDGKLNERPEELLGVYMQLIQVDAGIQQDILEIDGLEARIRRFADSIEAFLIQTGLLTPSARSQFRNLVPPGRGRSDSALQGKVIPLFGDSADGSE